MKKSLQITLKDNSKINIDATIKTTQETSIKVHELFEEGISSLLLTIEHEELNTLLDLTKARPFTLLYFYEGNFFAAAAFSNNETAGPFFINTQYKKILFIPSTIKFLPGDIFKYTPMTIVEKKTVEKIFQHRAFINGYGKFPYIILKAGYAIYMQIPIHFNTNGDFENYPGTNIDGISDELLAVYEKDKTSALHDRLINHCKWLKARIESENNREARICLVEGPEIAYYFEGDKITFNNSIPSGGTLVTQQNSILSMNVEHYIN